MIKDTIQQAVEVYEQLRKFSSELTIIRAYDGRYTIHSPALNCKTCRHENCSDDISERCRVCICAETAYALWEPKK